jgi:hypothetical protein
MSKNFFKIPYPILASQNKECDEQTEQFYSKGNNFMAQVKDYVDVIGTHCGESAKAVKFLVHTVASEPIDPPKSEWFPFSQVDKIFRDPSTVGQDTITVSKWILGQKGLM